MNFASLLSLGQSYTVKAQAEQAEKERLRLAAAKEAALAQARKEVAERKASEERRREREADERRRAAEELRKASELPATRNLYALKQERKKRGLDPDGKDDHLLESRAASTSHSHTSKKSSSSSASAKASAAAGLTREEKAAKQRAALFREQYDEAPTGGMALAQMARNKTDARTLGGSAHAGPSSGVRAAVSAKGTNQSRTPSISSMPKHLRPGLSRSSSSSSATSNSAAAASARDRLKAGFDPKAYIQLNTEKRDRRTIEEIEMDMKLKRSGGSGTASPMSGRDVARPIGKAVGRAIVAHVATPKRRNEETLPSSSSKRPRLDSGAVPTKSKNSNSSHRRAPSSEGSSGSSGDDSESEDERPRSKPGRSSGYGLNEDMRSEIWKLMGRDRKADVSRDAYSDEDDEDMEATEAEVFREDQRAARLAAKEDQQEQERLKQYAEKKRLAKAGKAGK